MNLPNKLTILRIILVPFFVFFLLTNCLGDASKWVALAIFIIASFTDFLDGKIARKYNLVTNFGKFMDPIADKLLVCSALICLTEMSRLEGWIVIIIIGREFIINGFRLVASDRGVVIAASYWGKFKTVFQIILTCLLIADFSYPPIVITTAVVKWVALALTIISLVDYIIKNYRVLGEPESDDAKESVEEKIISFLTDKKMTVTTAESCTGGMVASRLINISGASSVYNEGFVTYSNKAKEKYLGVNADTLSKFGAVSMETAGEMAEGGCKNTGSDVCIAVTGIAGPTGGSEEKPVGLVYIGCSVKGNTVSKEFHFSGTRREIRESACEQALNLLKECISCSTF